MTGEEFIVNTLNNISDTIAKCNLYDVLFFFKSPLTGMIELRSGYFEDYFEAYQFSEYLVDIYETQNKSDKVDIPYICYVSGKSTVMYKPDQLMTCEVPNNLLRR